MKARVVGLPEKERQKSLKYSILDGAAFSATTGFGNSFIQPFAIALGLNNIQIGFLSSIPSLITAVSQVFSARLLDVVKNRKKLMLRFALLHGLMWIPIILIPFFWAELAGIYLIAFVSIYTLFDSMIWPVWMSFMGDLVKRDEEGRYFGKRNEITGLVALFSSFTAGMILSYFTGSIFIGFAVIFFIAMAARFISLFFLTKQIEPEYEFSETAYFSVTDFLKRMPESNFGKFVAFKSLLSFAMNIASPFFIVYMLRDLHLSYFYFTVIISASALTNIFSMPYWGKLADRYGNKHVMTACAALIPLYPILWLFSIDPLWLVLVQMFGGFVFSGFDLTAANFIFDSTSAPKRARCTAYLYLFEGIAVFAGAILGGFLATFLPKLFFVSNLITLFLVSAVLRGTVIASLVNSFKEKRLDLEEIPERKLFWTVVAVEPMHGLKRELKVIERFFVDNTKAIEREIEKDGKTAVGGFRKIIKKRKRKKK